ncbi:helix-turn-helix domain-containing protein [Streptomyces erythrochromogenes]|nr:helix-turn-helix domain-containing protein [Streptomyces erythrochromogenes]
MRVGGPFAGFVLPSDRARPVSQRTVCGGWLNAPVSRSDDVLKLHRLAHGGGSAALLGWLATRLGGWTGLVLHAAAGAGDPADPGGPEQGERPPGAAVRGAAEMSARGVRSAVLHDAGSATLLFALDDRRALAAVLPLPHPAEAPALLADAVAPLALVLRAEEAERREARAAVAEARSREAVLRLLMGGQLPIAHQIAEALRPSLPDPMRIHVAECRSGRLAEVARLCQELTGGRAWVVRCPVYVRHLIMLVPADEPAVSAGHDTLAGALTAVAPDCAVGVSGELPLSQAPAAYTQAFHALAVARGRGERHARFGPGPEPELAAREAGADWAGTLLAPLHAYEPRRPQDPDGQELRATAHAWLNFGSHATRLLKVHRNTLAARLRLIETLLGLDLTRLGDQAALSLALRLTPGAGRGSGAAPAGAPGLDAVLRDPQVTDWARAHLSRLTGPDAPAGARDTVRTWLAHDARLVPAAAALGVSVPGARKRLARIEALLERSLLQSPSGRYDLWLAHRAEELAE